MRELKFRAFDKDSLRMSEAKTLSNLYSQSEDWFGNRIWIEPVVRFVPESDCIIMQYTGLKDRNGKEIYEGDILQHYRVKTSIGTMEWQEEDARWTLFHPIDQFEIVGNIYENPELLKA